MKPHEELSFERIQKENHILLKSYWLFVYQSVRNRTIWFNQFSDHIAEHYTDAVAENSKRTNFPRTMWQRDALSWATYYEGLVIMKRLYDTMDIEFQLVYGDDEALYKYKIPVDWSYMDYNQLGVGTSIKNRGRISDALVVPPDLDRRVEGGLTYVLREIMIRMKLTRKELDTLVCKFMEEPDNVCTFTSKNPQNIKSSIIESMFKWNIPWDMFVRGLRVLGFTAISIDVTAIGETSSGGQSRTHKGHSLTVLHLEA